MFLRKYWLPLSVFLVAIAGVGLYLLATQPPPEPIVIYKPVEPLEKPTEQSQTETPVVQDTPEPQQNGHTHADGTWHAGPHEQEAVEQRSTAQGRELPSTTEDPKRRKWLREGEVKPGHFHSYDRDGYLVCDENGVLIQTPYGDPAFDIFTVIGFRPTYEEYQEYKKLGDRMDEAYHSGNMDEYNRLNAEFSRFRQEHQGELPDLTATTVFPDDHTPRTPEASERFARLVSEKKDQLYREWGLGYLLED